MFATARPRRVGVVSSYVHYKLLTEPGYTSFCDVNAHRELHAGLLSRYGSFWGVPVALGGVLFFAVVLALAGIAGEPSSPPGERRRPTSSRSRRSAWRSCCTWAGRRTSC